MESARYRLLKHRFLAGFRKMSSPLINVVRPAGGATCEGWEISVIIYGVLLCSLSFQGFPLIFHVFGE
jgi:hypothetical protein